MFKKTGVYIIENISTGKCYIGSTKKYFSHRMGNHLNELKKGVHHSIKLQRSFNKHGENAFRFRILEICENSSVREKEQEWIDIMQPFYNMTLKVGNPPPSMLGKTHSESAKMKMSRSAKGKAKSKSHRKSISVEMRRQWASGERVQSPVTSNTKINMSRARFGGILVASDKRGLELFSCWSIKDAEYILNIKHYSIADVLGGRRNSVYGYKFNKLPLVSDFLRLESKEGLKETRS